MVDNIQEETYHVVTSKKTTLVGARQLPEENNSNESRKLPEHHDKSTDVLDPGSQVWAREHEDGGASTVRDAVGRGKESIAGEPLDDELGEVGDTAVDDLVEEDIPEQQPDLAVAKDLPDLFLLDGTVEDTTLAASVLRDEHGTLLGGEATSTQDIVGHEEPQDDTPDDCQTTAEDVDDAPDVPAIRLSNTVKENATEHAANAVEAVEETSTGRLLFTDEPLGNDDHESRGDDSFEDTQEETANGETDKVLASSSAEKDGSPAEDESSHDFACGIVLGNVGGWPFGNEVGEVEDGSHPAVLVACHASGVEEIKDCRVSESLLVDVLQEICSTKKRHQLPVDLLPEFLEGTLIAHELFEARVGDTMLVEE